jgi:tRNA threonylcarbamoyladenosine biosynthesis protein TsaB
VNLLAIETATEACSVALHCGGDVLARFELVPRRHADLVLSMCSELLGEAGIQSNQLDAVAFGRGPGSFTGLRIAAGTVQGIAFGLDLPVLPVSTLAAMAQGAITERGVTHVLCALDARMDEVYWGAYQRGEDGLARAIAEELVCSPERVTAPAGVASYGVGSGWAPYGMILREQIGAGNLIGVEEDRYPDARYVLPLAVDGFRRGAAVPPEQAQPVYLRDEVAKKTSPP